MSAYDINLERLCKWLFCRGEGMTFEDYEEDKPDDAQMLLGDLEILRNYGTGELLCALAYAESTLNEGFTTAIEGSINSDPNAKFALWVDSNKMKDDYKTMDEDNFNCCYLSLAMDKNGFEFKPEEDMMVFTGLYYLSPDELEEECSVYDGT